MLSQKIVIAFLFITIGCITEIQAQQHKLKLNTIVLDAGHGGKDPGTSMGSIKEKDIALKVALKAGEIIKKQYPDVEVIYTRNKDVFVPLDKRAEIANNSKADLFISIHVNYFKSAQVQGAETFILGMHRSEDNLEVAKLENSVILLEEDHTTRYEGFDPNSAESYIMFELIQDEFLEQSRLFADDVQNQIVSLSKRKNRGVKQAGFLVLRETTMPSVLMELGYISNYSDRSYLSASNGHKDMALAISNAFSEYKKRFEQRSGVLLTNTDTILKQKETASTESIPAFPKQAIKSEVKATSTQKVIPNMDARSNSIKNIEALSGIWFGIQILTQAKIIEDRTEIFNDLPHVYYLFENGMHKYFTDVFTTYNHSIEKLSERRSHFPGAFPVAFKNGKKIKVSEARIIKE